jgi:hopanoid biosynthesis associated protein HpnK
VKRLIVTADDFGLSLAVNEAIEQAYREGILTATSLMVGAPAAADAVERARRLPGLKVGLHLAVVRSRPTLPRGSVQTLVDDDGNLPHGLVRAGFRYFFLARVRRQLESEIRAQFAAFRATGLPLDHVNAHNHMHLHPTVLGFILRIGPEYGLRAVRVPYESALYLWRGTRDKFVSRFISSIFLRPWTYYMTFRLRRAGMDYNEFIFGLHDTGQMTCEHVLRLIQQIPDGVSEIYFHPAAKGIPGQRPLEDGDACARELETLVNNEVRNSLIQHNIRTISFSDLATAR